MAMNRLPTELLVRILSLLPPSDRLVYALTCLRWAQAFAAPALTRDLWFTINGPRLHEGRTVVVNSLRQYGNLRLIKVHLSDLNSAFWMKVGPALRELELIECSWSPEVFYSTLQACPKLKSVTISNRKQTPLLNLPPGVDLKSIQNSMRNLHHLNLYFSVNADMLEHLLVLLPNVSSIGLSAFDQRSDFLSRLPGVLGTDRRITSLDSRAKFHTWDECERLLRISSPTLQKLQSYETVIRKGAFVALGDCRKLRNLDLVVMNDIVVNINFGIFLRELKHFPELEVLSIRYNCPEPPTLNPEDAKEIFDLEKLRKLRLCMNLRWCEPSRMAGHMSHIKGMTSLETLRLDVKGAELDANIFQMLTKLPSLRDLTVSNLRWDAKNFRNILFDLGKLRKLVIIGNKKCGLDEELYQRTETDLKIMAHACRPAVDRRNKRDPSCLEVLSFSNVRQMTDACLDCIAARHCRLKVFHVKGRHQMTRDGLVNLCRHETLLEELHYGWRKNTDGKLLGVLAELCPRLRLLEVVGPGKKSRKAIEAFRLRRPAVKVLS